MSKRGTASWVAVCAVALCAGVSAAVALGATPPPPPPPPTSTSTPPPTSTSTPPPSSSTAPPPTSTATTPHHKKHHKKHQTNGGQTTPVASTPTVPAQTGLASGTATIQHAGSNIPHIALVASIVAGGAILFSALVLAGLLAFARGRRGGPRGPEGGTITIR
jgi:hypothetical protein